MVVYLISGNGQGAGKTTLANKLVGPKAVYSIASSMRHELQRLYPSYDWFNKTQQYKDHTVVPEYKGKQDHYLYSVRDVMVEYGQLKCKNDPTYWVKRLAERMRQEVGISVAAVDDVRKVCEVNLLREYFPYSHHFHIVHDEVVKEPIYDNDQLLEMADYVVTR